MYVYVYMYIMYMYMYMYMYIYMYINICILCMYIYVYVYVYVYIYMSVCLFIYVCNHKIYHNITFKKMFIHLRTFRSKYQTISWKVTKANPNPWRSSLQLRNAAKVAIEATHANPAPEIFSAAVQLKKNWAVGYDMINYMNHIDLWIDWYRFI